jgi:hypothetical protein
MKRIRKVRLLHRDWIGYAVLVLICGSALLAATLLPWANALNGHSVNFSLGKAEGILAVMHTRWGVPALGLAIVVTLTAVAMLGMRPRRYTLLLGFLLAAAGAGCFALADNAAGNLGGMFSPGIGLYTTLFVGIILVPIGLATAIVAFLLARGYGATPRDRATPEAPGAPAPGPTGRSAP